MTLGMKTFQYDFWHVLVVGAAKSAAICTNFAHVSDIHRAAHITGRGDFSFWLVHGLTAFSSPAAQHCVLWDWGSVAWLALYIPTHSFGYWILQTLQSLLFSFSLPSPIVLLRAVLCCFPTRPLSRPLKRGPRLPRGEIPSDIHTHNKYLMK